MNKNSKKNMFLAAILGGMSVFGYMYLKRNPDIMCQMRELTKDFTKRTYERLEDME